MPLARGNGALHLVYTVEGEGCGHEDGRLNTYYRMSNGGLSPAGPEADFSIGRWSYIPSEFPEASASCHIEEIENAGVAVVETARGPQAFTVQSGESCPDSVVHIPNADGIADRGSYDTDDAAIMGSFMCLSLNAASPCRCIDPDASCATIEPSADSLDPCPDAP